MGKLARIVSGVVVAVLIVAVGATLALAWRLSRGPIDLGFLTGRLEAALAARDGSTTVDIGTTALEWDAADRDLDVRLRDVRILGSGGVPMATVPAVAVGIAPAPLLLGAVMPRSIEAISPAIHVVREADGRLRVGVGGGSGTDATGLLGALLRGGTAGGFGGVPVVRLRDGTLTVDDLGSGVTWRAQALTLAARQTPDGTTIERLTGDLAPGTIAATGRLRNATADLDVTLRDLPTSQLDRWWPVATAPAIRDWVLRNVTAGRVTRAQARVAASLDGRTGAGLRLDVATNRVAFGGVEVRWQDGMPPLTGVAGIADVAPTGWTFRLARGELEGIDIVRAVVTPASGAAQALRVDGVVHAPLSKVLALLERPGLRAVANIGFRPGEISGGTTAHVVIDAPLGGGPATVRADGELRSVSLRRAFRGRNVNARRMDFTLDQRELLMHGQVTIGRAPLELRWVETLSGPDRGRRVVDVTANLDADGRQAMGLDLSDWVQGPVGVVARLEPKAQASSAMQVQVDLTPATLTVPLINLVKDAGAPGRADARLVLGEGRLVAVDEFRLRAAGSTMDGRALFGPGETWRTAELAMVIPPRSHGGDPGRARIALQPAGRGNALTVTSDDPGAALRAVDAYADARGGRMTLTGEIRLGVPGIPVVGTLQLDRFVLTRSPMIAKIAAMGSITAIVDALAGDGLPFSQMNVTFTQRAGVITVSEGVGAGSGVALTFRGSVDRARDDLSLEGTMVPNYAVLDRLTKDVATVTALPPGAESVQAVDFSASGSLADPYVAATPATLSPATLRSLLRLTTSRLGAGRADRRGREGALEEPALEEPPARGKRRRGARPAADTGSPRSGAQKKKPGGAVRAGQKPRSPSPATRPPAGGAGAP